MARITVSFDVPELLREHFISPELNPFTPDEKVIKVDRDNITEILLEVLFEIKYQKQRDHEIQKPD